MNTSDPTNIEILLDALGLKIKNGGLDASSLVGPINSVILSQYSSQSSSSGVLTVDCSASATKRTITLSENITGWSFTNAPSVGEFRDLYFEFTQTSPAKTVALPSGDKVAGGPWVMPITNGASVTVGCRINGDGTREWFPSGEYYTI